MPAPGQCPGRCRAARRRPRRAGPASWSTRIATCPQRTSAPVRGAGDFRECTPVAGLAMMDRGSSRSAKGAVAMVSTHGGPLSGLRVIEVSGELGRFAGKILAESGASVARVGRPTSGSGDARRRARRTRRPPRLVDRGRQARRRHRPHDPRRRRRLPPPGRVGRPRDRHHGAGVPRRARHRPRRPRGGQPPPRPGVADAVRAHRSACRLADQRPRRRRACRGVLSISGTPDEADRRVGPPEPHVRLADGVHLRARRRVPVPRDRPRRARRPLAARGDDVVDREPLLPVVVPRPAADPAAGAAPGIAALARRLRRDQRQARRVQHLPRSRSRRCCSSGWPRRATPRAPSWPR